MNAQQPMSQAQANQLALAQYQQAVAAQSQQQQGQTVGGCGPGNNMLALTLEAPYFIPLFEEPAPGSVVIPKATPIGNNSVRTLVGRLPLSQTGSFTLMGWYAWWAVPTDAAAPNAVNHPLTWVDPQGGVYSLDTPNSNNPPEFVGPEEGDQIFYGMQINEQIVDLGYHDHTLFQLNTIPAPADQAAGATIKVQISRGNCTRFAVGQNTHLFFGLFGRIRYTVPPLARVDSNVQISLLTPYASRRLIVPAGGTPVGLLSQPAPQGEIVVTKVHPSDFDSFKYAGQGHLYVKAKIEQGPEISADFLPARIFSAPVSGGRLPYLWRMAGGGKILIDLVQPLILPDQPAASGAFWLQGGSYGIS